MTDDFETPLLDSDDESLVGIFWRALAASVVVITVVCGTVLYIMQPDWTVAGAYGTGFFVGFWMSPLAAGVAANGIHESRLKAREAAPIALPSASDAEPASVEVAA